MQQTDWSEALAYTVGRQVRRYRDQRGLSAQKLADACTELGVPIERSVLAGLETGRRKTVTVAEVVAFAHALEVAPLALIYPIEESSLVEVVPGRLAESLAASKWFAGDAPFPETPEGVGEAEMFAWGGDISALSQLRKHDEATRIALTAAAAARKTLNAGPFALLQDTMNDMAETIEEAVRAQRQALRSQGVTPPPLPAGMEYIDSGEAPAVVMPTGLIPVPKGTLSDEERAAFGPQAEAIVKALEAVRRFAAEEKQRREGVSGSHGGH